MPVYFNRTSAFILLLLCSTYFTSLVKADAEENKPSLENSYFKFRVITRAPVQMTAFYEGRGFPEQALELIKTTCFITAIVRNKEKDVVWLELKNWRFFNDNGEITRLDRNFWHEQWQKLNVDQASRSTFDWTLMPETRNLQPHEPVGGNVIIPHQQGSFSIDAIFSTGENKRGNEIRAGFSNLTCPDDVNGNIDVDIN